MSVGVNYLREHVPTSRRIHYAYLDAGGIAPNVVQAPRQGALLGARAVAEAGCSDLNAGSWTAPAARR